MVIHVVGSGLALFEPIHMVRRIGVIWAGANLRNRHLQSGLLAHDQARDL